MSQREGSVDAPLPEYNSNTLNKRMRGRAPADIEVKPTDVTSGKVALFGTCFGNYNHPELGEDFFEVFEHNGIPVTLVQNVQCCGMPKYDLGDLDTVEKLKDHNVPRLAELVDDGWDIVTLIPSCTLMFKQEIPLMYPQDEQVEKVKEAVFDPFEYLMLRHKAGLLNTEFKNPLGTIAYQVAGHEKVVPYANEDLERSTDDKTSAVHFMRFEFTDEMIAALKSGAGLTLGVTHPEYSHNATVPANVRESLIGDFD